MRPHGRTGGRGTFLNMVFTYWVRRIMIALAVCTIVGAVARAWLQARWPYLLIVEPKALWGGGVTLPDGSVALAGIPAFWQLLTHPYFEMGILGFIFGLAMLGWFGGQMELMWGSRRFLTNFLILTIGPAVATACLGAVWAPASTITIAGVDTATLGIFVAWALTNKDQPVWFIVTMKGIHMLYLLLGVMVLFAFFGGPSTVIASIPLVIALGIGFILVSDKISIRKIRLQMKKAQVEYALKREESKRKKRMEEVGLRVVGEEEEDADDEKPDKEWLH